MRYSKPIVIAVAALAAGLCFAAPAAAEDAATRYNMMLARRQFLVSPSPVRSYWGLEPGSGYAYPTRTGYVWFWGGPGHRHERVSPRGYERFDLPADSGWRTLDTVDRVLSTRKLDSPPRVETVDRVLSTGRVIPPPPNRLPPPPALAR